MGTLTVTIQNLEIVQVDLENNVILVKGNVPGPKKSLVMIRTSVKKGEKINEMEELITYVELPVEEISSNSEEVESNEVAEVEVVESNEDNKTESSQE